MRVELVVRRRERVEVLDGGALRARPRCGRRRGRPCPAMPCVGLPALRGGRPARGTCASLSPIETVSMSGWCASISRASGVACGPPTTTCARGCSRLISARHERHAAAVRRPAGQAEEVRVERRAATSSTRRHAKRRQVDDLDLVPRAQRLRAEGEEAVRRLEEVARRDPPRRTRWAAPRRPTSGASPGMGIFQGGGYSRAMRIGGSRGLL